MNKQPLKIRPVFSHSKPNESISLGVENVEVTIDGNLYPTIGEIVLEFLPRPTIKFNCTLRNLHISFFGHNSPNTAELYFPNRGIRSDAIISKRNPGAFSNLVGDGDIIFSVSREPCNFTWGRQQKRIKELVFDLVNFPVFSGSCRQFCKNGNHVQFVELIDMVGGGWDVWISSYGSTKDMITGLKESGGYAITHFGHVARSDGSRFSGEDAENILEIIHHFLSFARGAWVTPILAIGRDDFGDKVWEQWRSPHGNPWYGGISSWFDVKHGGQLSDLFPGFVSLWNKNKFWKEAVE